MLTVRLEEADCLDAAVAAGVQRAAAQTCLAMLSEPGGLYLDVKSAYSTPHDLQARAAPPPAPLRVRPCVCVQGGALPCDWPGQPRACLLPA